MQEVAALLHPHQFLILLCGLLSKSSGRDTKEKSDFFTIVNYSFTRLKIPHWLQEYGRRVGKPRKRKSGWGCHPEVATPALLDVADFGSVY
uniref:Putative secreted protein n=1 Tax=Rhipicephalus microplus TaxID=6941 RepID=A0A6M2DCS6_RHIMP